MADKKENVQLEKTMDKAEQEKLESVKKADAAVKWNRKRWKTG